MPRDRLRLAAAIGLQLLILALVPARQVLASWRGQELTLATAPVDPHDPFSGAYVRLAYEVEAPPSSPPRADLREGDTVYVVVQRAEPAWRRVEIVTEPPAPASGRAALRAEWRAGRPRLMSAGRLYLPAEQAKAAEQAQRDQQQRWREAHPSAQSLPVPAPAQAPGALVDLRVDGAGNLRLLRLRVDDRVFGD